VNFKNETKAIVPKQIIALTGLSLKECKDMVDSEFVNWALQIRKDEDGKEPTSVTL